MARCARAMCTRQGPSLGSTARQRSKAKAASVARASVRDGTVHWADQTTLPAACDQQTLAVFGQIADHFVGHDVVHYGADRHDDDLVVATLAVHLPAHAVLAALGAELGLVAEVDQRVEVLVGHQPDTAAIAAVAAIRATQRYELLAAKADAAVAAIACADLDFGFVDEFHFWTVRSDADCERVKDAWCGACRGGASPAKDTVAREDRDFRRDGGPAANEKPRRSGALRDSVTAITRPQPR